MPAFPARLSAYVASERGQTFAFAALAMFVLIAMVALAVDVGLLMGERTKLQAVADASALAAAQDLPDEGAVDATAVAYAADNHPGNGQLVDPAEVKIGLWDGATRTFYPDSGPVNAVEVWVRRIESRGNSVPLLFARVLGRDQWDVAAHAIATGASEGVKSRFILDEEMFDSDIPAIEEIALPLKDQGVIGNLEDVIKDLDGDWIIDLHQYVIPYRSDCPGCPTPTTIELPTGQVGDEGVFDMGNDAFPFADDAIPCSEATIPASATDPCSFSDFLNYNESDETPCNTCEGGQLGMPREDLIPKEWLDPLVGVATVSEPGIYPSFVGGGCQASPVYKSDISDLGMIGDVPAVQLPAVNALGERRGLVIFRIVGVCINNPDCDYNDDPGDSVLPNMLIQVCDPSELGSGGIASIRLGQGLRYRLVD